MKRKIPKSYEEWIKYQGAANLIGMAMNESSTLTSYRPYDFIPAISNYQNYQEAIKEICQEHFGIKRPNKIHPSLEKMASFLIVHVVGKSQKNGKWQASMIPARGAERGIVNAFVKKGLLGKVGESKYVLTDYLLDELSNKGCKYGQKRIESN